MLDSVQLETFAAVIRAGSFEGAAAALRVTPSAVSQRIKALEQSVGQVLIRRGKPCRATVVAEPLLRLAGQIALLEQEALHAARGGPAAGRTRVAVVVNSDSLATWFLPALTRLPAEFALDFDLHEEDQDHTADLLRDGTVMAAVTAQHEAVRGCRVERLGVMRYLAVAAPAFARRYFPAGFPADAFAVAPMLAFNRKDSLQHRFVRTLTRRQPTGPLHYVPSVAGFNEAIRLGLAWGLLPESHAHAELDAGRCVQPAPGAFLDVPLYWQHWRVDSTVLAALTVAVRETAGEALRPAA